MKMKILDAKQTSEKLKKLIDKHDKICIASAWGSSNAIAKQLFKHQDKFRSVMFGLAFCQTDPDLVDKMVGVENAKVALSDQGTFHPKIYFFTSGDKAEAIIGSSNFTNGGLGINIEANIHLKGHSDDDVFDGIREALKRYMKISHEVTAELAESYRINYQAAKRLPKPKHPSLVGSKISTALANSQLVRMDWEEFSKNARKAKYNSFSKRLALLREAQKIISGASSFKQLTPLEWKALAGIIGKNEVINSGLEPHDWGWFGSMVGFGYFKRLIGQKDKKIARAIDMIPRHGEIDQQQYNRYCDSFTGAFDDLDRTAGVATATRLLAMKRPDVFVCISSPNAAGIAKALGYAKTKLDLTNYWDWVVEPIRLSTWYNSKRPIGKDGELWDNRAAMLDAIYYA